MSPAEIDGYRKRLVALGRRLIREVDQLRGEALHGTGGESGGGLSDVPLHLADLGTAAAEEDLALDLVGSEEHILGEIAAAVERIDAGTFGRCEGCGEEIPRARLDALPYARRCIRCAAKAEGGATRS
jgi:RNA polymerase-binding transcription factor DksA